MTDYIEQDFNELENDNFFYYWYEIEGLTKIRELSRQLRTFFKFKAEVLKLRFQTSLKPNEDHRNTQFYTQKQEVESLSSDFINLLKKIKKSNFSLEEAISSLFFESNKKQLYYLLEIIKKLSKLIHQFSEMDIQIYPKFLKFIIVLAKNICFVKKCLQIKFSGFFEELETNYFGLEEELEDLLEKTPSVKVNKSKEQYEEGLSI